MSKLNIKTQQKLMPVAKHLYGIFLEDINRAVDGGLYPEMLRNRSFEDSIPPEESVLDSDGYSFISNTGWRDEFNHGEGLTRWMKKNQTPYTPIPGWYGENASMDLNREQTLNVNRQAALQVVFRPGGRIFNAGFCGICLAEGSDYHLYLFARAAKPVSLEISVGISGQQTRQTCGKILVNGDFYQRYDLDFTASCETSQGKLEISCKEGGEVLFGFASLMPVDTYKGHGLRKDIAQKLEDIKPGFFRFPGGCIVEGFSPSTAMRFCNTVGPVWERKTHQLMWHYRTYNGVGFHEYLQFCEDLDMEPLYVCNCGMTCQARKEVLMEGQDLEDMLQDTLNAIEYALGDETTRWGGLRAQMGHPEPFKLNYIEIGNENWGEEYEKRYQIFYRAIKEAYPHIVCIANSHLEQKGLPAEIVDEHYYDTAEYFAEHTHMFDGYDRKGPEIFLGEVSVVRGFVAELYGALGEAAFFTGVERNQDIVTLAAYAPLLENVNYDAWFPNLIRFNNKESIGIPSYYVWKMFGNHTGTHVVSFTEETGRIYRPLKGMASLFGMPGLRYKNAFWNGRTAKVGHELMGVVEEEKRNFVVKEPTLEQRTECARYNCFSPEEIFIVLGEGKEEEGVFSIDISLPDNSPRQAFTMGIFASPIPKEVYISDETNPPKEWNVSNVKPLLWKIEDGNSILVDQVMPENVILAKAEGVYFSSQEYQTISYRYERNYLELYLNDQLIHRVEMPWFAQLSTVVCDSEQEVIIKTVNMGETEEPVEITLDCPVRSDYRVICMSGDKRAGNTFEEPEKVRDREYAASGADKQFTYCAPAYSVNVLVLKKEQA